MQKKKSLSVNILGYSSAVKKEKKKLHNGSIMVYGVDPSNSYSQAAKKYSEKKKSLFALKT